MSRLIHRFPKPPPRQPPRESYQYDWGDEDVMQGQGPRSEQLSIASKTLSIASKTQRPPKRHEPHPGPAPRPRPVPPRVDPDPPIPHDPNKNDPHSDPPIPRVPDKNEPHTHPHPRTDPQKPKERPRYPHFPRGSLSDPHDPNKNDPHSDPPIPRVPDKNEPHTHPHPRTDPQKPKERPRYPHFPRGSLPRGGQEDTLASKAVEESSGRTSLLYDSDDDVDSDGESPKRVR